MTIPRPENHLTPANIGLSYTVARIALPDCAWLKGWYVAASRPLGLVLMFPPYAATKESLLAPARTFHDMDYATFLVDYRGAGGSSGSDTTLGVRRGATSRRRSLMPPPIGPVPGPFCTGFPWAPPRFARGERGGVRPTAVILESPFDRLVGTVRNRFRAMGLPPSPGAEMVIFWGSLELGFDGFTHNPVDLTAAAVTCPALLLHGDRDSRATPDEATAVFAALQDPKQMIEVFRAPDTNC